MTGTWGFFDLGPVENQASLRDAGRLWWGVSVDCVHGYRRVAPLTLRGVETE